MIGGNYEKQKYVIASGDGRIRPRARLIRTIGAELISSEIVAVLELVRNSYDADARKIEIRFDNPQRPEEATLTIRDDGHGMTREVFLGPWLEPATDHKSSGGEGLFSGERSPRGRRRLGSKGVGRFATQRLGEHLLVSSKSKASNGVFEANFDWNILDNSDSYLDELIIPWREIQAEKSRWHGTDLHISKLRDNWAEERFERLRLALSRLLGPGLGDAFRIDLVVNGIKEEIKPFIDSLPAMYSIDGSVLNDGTCAINYRDITGKIEHWQRSVLWPMAEACGPFKFRISSWDLDREALEYFFGRTNIELGLRDFRRTIRDHSGISLYRDGFRILPYGEPDNDWLRLDRRRVNNPTLRLSNNQILGWVQLTADENPLLQDQTNREGLVANRAYSHLQQAILELISYLEGRRFTSRRSFGLANRNNDAPQQPIRAQVDEHLEELIVKLAQKSNGSGEILPELREAIRRSSAANLGAVQRYLQLAGAGSCLPLIVSELQYPLKQAHAETSFLLLEVASGELPSEAENDLLTSLEKLERSLNELQERVESLERMATTQTILWTQMRLSDCIEKIGGLFTNEFVRAEIEFDVVIETDPAIVAISSIVEQVSTLLFENAVFWLRQTKMPRRLTVRIKSHAFTVENNGTPIPRELEEKVFEASFTTREGASGLGLALARDLLKAVGGTIQSLRRSKGAAFEVTLPNHT